MQNKNNPSSFRRIKKQRGYFDQCKGYKIQICKQKDVGNKVQRLKTKTNEVFVLLFKKELLNSEPLTSQLLKCGLKQQKSEVFAG